MLLTTPLTLQQALEWLWVIAERYHVASDLDAGLAILAINRAWRSLAAFTLYKDEDLWIAQTDVTWGTELPVDFVRPRVCYLGLPDGDAVEARYVNIREFLTLSDWNRGHTFNVARIHRPVYTIWGKRPWDQAPPSAAQIGLIPVPTRRVFYCAPCRWDNPAPLSAWGEEMLPSGVDTLVGTLEYYCLPHDVTEPNAFLPLRGHYHEAILYYSLFFLLGRHMPREMAQFLLGNLKNWLSRIREAERESRRARLERLQVFLERIFLLYRNVDGTAAGERSQVASAPAGSDSVAR